MMNDKLNEECGVMGVFGDPEAANLIYLGLYALQHRGQEACGIVTFDHPPESSTKLYVHKAFGLVSDSINKEVIATLKGDTGIGHVRYSTQGGKFIENIQPFQFKTALGPIAIAHNGNLTNAKMIRNELEAAGSIFHTTSDSEVFIHLILKSGKSDLKDRVVDAMARVQGAYSLCVLSKDRLFALRDPFGFRPLVLGKKGNATIVASESCALDLLDAEVLRDVEPGEVVEISRDGMKSHSPLPKKPTTFCSFEPIYFARPDTLVQKESIYALRRKMGRQLAMECPAPKADVVIAVPDSGVPMAIGYSQESGIPYEVGLVRNHYVGRTFIEPTQAIRDFGVKLKLNPVPSLIKGKSIVVVDDSLVRGTTSAKILRMLREAGAKEIHFRIGSPPITHSCFYGVDTPDRAHLLAAQKRVEEICELIGADSLGFLSIDGLQNALGPGHNAFCYACFSGKYPEKVNQTIKEQPTDKSGPGLTAHL